MPVAKQKATKLPVKTDLMEITDVNIPQDNLDINKLRTVTGHGRVSVAADEWISYGICPVSTVHLISTTHKSVHVVNGN